MKHCLFPLVLMLVAAGCGGSKRHDTPGNATGSGGAGRTNIPSICRSPSSNCVALSSDDLPDAFYGWPELQRAYRNGRRFDVYTSLGDGQTNLAVRLCDSVFGDLIGNGPGNPLILVYSGDLTPVATGAAVGAGCTPF